MMKMAILGGLEGFKTVQKHQTQDLHPENQEEEEEGAAVAMEEGEEQRLEAL